MRDTDAFIQKMSGQIYEKREIISLRLGMEDKEEILRSYFPENWLMEPTRCDPPAAPISFVFTFSATLKRQSGKYYNSMVISSFDYKLDVYDDGIERRILIEFFEDLYPLQGGIYEFRIANFGGNILFLQQQVQEADFVEMQVLRYYPEDEK